MNLTNDDLTLVATVDSYEVVNNDYCQYTIRVELANGNAVPWTVVRRFSDFDALHWALKPLGPPWSEYELPPKRRWIFWDKHNPEFLGERHRLLKQLLNSMLSNDKMPPPPLRQFLEVEAHVDLDEMESMVQYNSGVMGGGAMHMTSQEEHRLKNIVDKTAMALIDVTRDTTDDIIDLDEINERREEFLRALAEQMQQDQEGVVTEGQSRRPEGDSGEYTVEGRRLPVPSATVFTAEGLIDTLTRPPAISPADQERLIDTYGLKLSDLVRDNSTVSAAVIGACQDLVVTMDSL